MSGRIESFVMFGALLVTAAVRAQAPAEAPPRASAPARLPDAAPTPPSNFVYESEGRRDPFASLANRGIDGRKPHVNGVRPDGLTGVMVDELVVRGVVQSRGSWMAIVEGANERAYVIRPGDRLMDGSVRSINAEAVVLMQDNNDSLSLATQREVRKYLRGEVR
jgi:Tfp pilus assembly protein PilP